MTASNLTPSRRGLLTGVAGGLALAGAAALGGPAFAQRGPIKILNVSYDPTRELYKQFNAAFSDFWKKHANEDVTVGQSNAGSGAQARAVIDGLNADVVTLALAYDIDAIADKGLIAKNWQSRLPNNSTPYVSTIVFLVRKGNPKGIHDWGDLIKPGVQVITPNPKTSGGARWNFLAAWAYGQKLGGAAGAKDFVKKLYGQVPVLDSGARGATTSFAERGLGDVLLAWENEAYLSQAEYPGKFDIVAPSISVLAEPPVSLVDKNVDKNGTRLIATGYLNFLYSPLGQDIVGQNHYRPRNKAAYAKYAANFAKMPLVTIDGQFGGWRKAQATFFADGGVFDQIYSPH